MVANVTELPTDDQQASKLWLDGAEDDAWNDPQASDVAKVNELREKYESKEALIKFGVTFIAKYQKSTDSTMRQLSALSVALKSKFTAPGSSLPDWGGDSGAYKAASAKMYRDAGVPAARYGGIRNAIKYHVQNLTVEVAPAKELEALGIDPVSRRERSRQAGQRRRDAKKKADEAAEAATKLQAKLEAENKKLKTKVATISKAPATKAEPTDNPLILAKSLAGVATHLNKLVKANGVQAKDREAYFKQLGQVLDLVQEAMTIVATTLEEETARAETERKSA